MTRWTLALLLAALPAGVAAGQEPKPVPRGSVEIVTPGCLTGRAFTAIQPSEDYVRRGPNVTGRTFRVAGKKDVMKLVKQHNGHLVEVSGLVQTSALNESGLGKRIGNTRVVIGSPGGSNPVGRPSAGPISNVVVMDLNSVRFLSDSCPIEKR